MQICGAYFFVNINIFFQLKSVYYFSGTVN